MCDSDFDLLISLYLSGKPLMNQDDFDNLSAWIKEESGHTRLFIKDGFTYQFLCNLLLEKDINKRKS